MGNSRKDDKKKIKDVSKEIGTEISEVADKEIKKSKVFAKTEKKKNKYDLDYVRLQIAKERIITGFRTLTGRVVANLDRGEFIRKAENASKEGDLKKLEYSLDAARVFTEATMGEVRNLNYGTRSKTHKEIATRNQMEGNSRRQARTIAQMKKGIDEENKVWADERSKGSSRNAEVVRDIR